MPLEHVAKFVYSSTGTFVARRTEVRHQLSGHMLLHGYAYYTFSGLAPLGFLFVDAVFTANAGTDCC